MLSPDTAKDGPDQTGAAHGWLQLRPGWFLPGQHARAAQPALALPRNLTLPSVKTKRHQGKHSKAGGKNTCHEPNLPTAKRVCKGPALQMSPTPRVPGPTATPPRGDACRQLPGRTQTTGSSQRSSLSHRGSRPDGPLPADDRPRSGSRQITAHPELLSRDHTPDCPLGYAFDSGRAWDSPGQSPACALVTLGRTAPAPRFQCRSGETRKKRSPALLPQEERE